jgi:hypothetical protein
VSTRIRERLMKHRKSSSADDTTDDDTPPLVDAVARPPCLYCRGEEFLRVDDFDFANTYWMSEFALFVCTRCGHVDLFVTATLDHLLDPDLDWGFQQVTAGSTSSAPGA